MDCYTFRTMGLLLMVIICTAAKTVVTNSTDNSLNSNATYEIFKHFIDTYNKTYSSITEISARYKIFKQSLERHKVLNAARTHPQEAVYGVTQFSDLTPQEFSASVLGHRSSGGLRLSKFNSLSQTIGANDIPLKYDLRNRKPSVFSPIRDQGSCGGCWAFSIVECMETQYAMKKGKLLELSPQQVIDCADTPADHGCNGGNLCATLIWLNDTKQAIVTEKLYPYKAKTGQCKKFNSTKDVAKVVDYSCGGHVGNEDTMVSLLYTHGPLSVAVDATSWQDYIGGIIQHHCYDRFDNHAVQIVGYDKTGDVPYYIVRNSWGSQWGSKGYLNIKIGSNLCGIANTVGTVDIA